MPERSRRSRSRRARARSEPRERRGVQRRRKGRQPEREAAESPQQEAATGRAVWSGSITFGLVSVPVEMYTAQRPGGVSLRMLTPDGTPLVRRYVCPAEGTSLSRDEIERGYEIAEGTFVVVSDDDLAQLAPRGSREIALERFVPRESIDPAWLVRTYVLAPGREQRRAYDLLAETMQATGRVGIAHFVMRGRSHAVAVFADHGLLRTAILRFGDELRTPETLGLPAPGRVPAARVEEMRARIEALAAPELDATELEDPASARLRALAAEKRARGQGVVELPDELGAETAELEQEEAGELIDLMALLKQRLGARKGARPAGRRASPSDSSLEHASKHELYERARELGIPGRSRMSRDELLESLRSA